MVTEKGETLQGGDRGMTLELGFRLKNGRHFDASSEANTFRLIGNIHDADIENELILGYPWLRENNLAVRPPRDF